MRTDELTFDEIRENLAEQGVQHQSTFHHNKNFTKCWVSVILEDGSLYAKQHATKLGDGSYFLCNEYADTKGVV